MCFHLQFADIKKKPDEGANDIRQVASQAWVSFLQHIGTILMLL